MLDLCIFTQQQTCCQCVRQSILLFQAICGQPHRLRTHQRHPWGEHLGSFLESGSNLIYIYFNDAKKRFTIWGEPPQNKTVFLGGESFPKSVYPLTHPRVFVRFGKTKGEIWVEKAIFGVIWGVWGVWALFGNQPPLPPTFGKNFPKKRFYIWGAHLMLNWKNCGRFLGWPVFKLWLLHITAFHFSII